MDRNEQVIGLIMQAFSDVNDLPVPDDDTRAALAEAQAYLNLAAVTLDHYAERVGLPTRWDSETRRRGHASSRLATHARLLP